MISLALDRYDRHLPFFDGTVKLPGGLALDVIQAGQSGTLRDGTDRHERMLRDGEFDAAETSLASYLVAVDRGLPFTAIPVFPRRLFSQGQIFVNAESGIEAPGDLAGRTVGLQSFQTTLAVLAKGDLASEYGVDLRSVKWRLRHPDTVAVDYGPEFDIERLLEGSDLGELLADGAIDALFFSRTPTLPPGRQGRIRRLFADPRAAEAAYVERNGYWPIMHILALKDEAVAARPHLPGELMEVFSESERCSASFMDDPNWSRLAWAKYSREEEAAAFGRNLWTAGIAANRANLERFIGYALDQRLISRPLAVDELFHPSVLGS